ncbi:MAG: protein kinase [Bryobacteraceae bacterium]|nr:protein kinase [Bryobacteraceae bacterium]
MAVVCEARDRKTSQRVAVKVPKLPFRRRLLAELESALEVTHFNICRVHSIHSAQTEAGPVDFLTMEYLEGETLAHRLRSAGRLPLEEVEPIAQQICSGLAAAHDREVIHGDLKPGNVILARTRKGGLRAVITAFGLARAAPAFDSAGTAVEWSGKVWRIAALLAALLLLAALVGRWAFEPALPPVVRLAVLPPESASETTVLASGMALDWSARLRSARPSERRLNVIPLSKAVRYHVATPQEASSALGATHTVQLLARNV